MIYFTYLSSYFWLSTLECKLHGDRNIFRFCFLLGSAYRVLAHSTPQYIFVKWKKKSLPNLVLGVQKGWKIVGYEIAKMTLASGDHFQDVARGVDYRVAWRESVLELKKSKRPQNQGVGWAIRINLCHRISRGSKVKKRVKGGFPHV